MRLWCKFAERLNLPLSSVVIQKWNGAPLKQYLADVLDELQNYNPESECIIVADTSTDNSISLLEELFPSMQVIRGKRNCGFGSALTPKFGSPKTTMCYC